MSGVFEDFDFAVPSAFRLANYKKYLILFKKEWGELSLRLD
jgi:hypothetical protein